MPPRKISELWHDPPKEFRPLVRWWWPGMDVEEDVLRAELSELDNAYFGGVELQPFLFGVPGQIRGQKDRIHRYAPHDYFSNTLTAVLSEAKRRGLLVDLTIGSGWPPGGVHVNQPDSLQTLLFGVTQCEGGALIEMKPPIPQLPPYFKHQKLMKGLMGPIFDAYYADEFKIISIIAVQPQKRAELPNFLFPKRHPLSIDSAQDISDHLDANGVLHWDAPSGKWQIFAFYAGPSGMTPMNDAKSDPARVSLVVDLFNDQRIQSFLAGLFGGFLEQCPLELRSSLRAFFTDSQEVASEWFWTEDFAVEFQKRRGYDVRPFLPVCFVPNRDNQFIEVLFQGESPCYEFPEGIGERIRHDWLATLSELWAERYCGGIAQWGKKYGIQHRIQPYGIKLDLLQAHAYADIPETEQLYAGGLLDFLKLAGSAGLLFQKPVVSCESMVWRNRDHMTTPFKWKVAADRLFVAGINQMIYHGYPYVHPEIPYPGYDPWSWCSSNFNHHNSFHPYFDQMNAYVARAQYLLRQGNSVVQIGVYFPYQNYNHKCMKKEDLAGGFLEGFDAPPAGGLIMWFLSRPRKPIDHLFLKHQILCDELISQGYNYVHVNDFALSHAEWDGKRLNIGHASLEALVFPNIESLDLSILERITEWAAQGLKVLFINSLPNRQSGYLNYQENDLKVQSIIEGILQKKHAIFYSKNNRTMAFRDLFGLRSDISFEKCEPTLQYIHKITPEGDLYFIRHSGSHFYDTSLTFISNSKPPVVFDLVTGKIYPIPSARTQSEKWFMPLIFPPYGSVMILFPNHESELKIESDTPFTIRRLFLRESKQISKEILLNRWDLSVEERNIEGVLTEISISLDTLKDWRKIPELKYSIGPGIYKTTINLSEDDIDVKRGLILNLGLVHDVAELIVNNIKVVDLLFPPYEYDITDHMNVGQNTIEIRVVGCLRNRLVGYGQKSMKFKGQSKKSLMPCGMIGPAVLQIISDYWPEVLQIISD